MSKSPHDALFKSAFGKPEIARSELEHMLPSALRAQLDLRELDVVPGSFVDEELRHAHADLLYRTRAARGGDALVYFLFEHQSSFDALMPLRLLRYVVRVWERWLADHPGSSSLPVVVPMLLHHGPNGWQAAPELASLLDAPPELLEAARPYLPLFRFLLDDLGATSLEELSSRTVHAVVKLVELAFWSSRSLPRLLRAAPMMQRLIATLSHDEPTRALLRQLYFYVLRTSPPDVDAAEVRTILLRVAGPDGREDVMNAGEQLIEEGRALGLAKGLVEGQLNGLRMAIRTTLEARSIPLSEIGRARLSACKDEPTLVSWLARAATAPREADVFGGAETP
jgi:predicted transposase/invertase (TIGR01784 family)